MTLGDVAEVKLAEGPATIKSEKGMLRNYVRFNLRGREVLRMVAEAQQRVAERVPLPEGVFLKWTGQYEHQARARRTLWIVAPLVLLSILGILWVTYRDVMDALLIVPARIVTPRRGIDMSAQGRAKRRPGLRGYVVTW